MGFGSSLKKFVKSPVRVALAVGTAGASEVLRGTVKGIKGLTKVDVDPVTGAQLSPEEVSAKQELLTRLRAQAEGKDAITDQLAARGLSDLQAANMSQAASVRGIENPALAFRTAMMSNQAAADSLAGQKLNAQQTAQLNLQNYVSGRDAQAIQQNMFNTQQQNAANAQSKANQLALIGSVGNIGAAFATGGGSVAAQGAAGATQGAMQQPQANYAPAAQQPIMNSYWNTNPYSDEKLKKDIKKTSDAGNKVEDLLDKLVPSTYKYKNQKHGEGERLGIMAQDLEKSELGKSLVKDGPEGKQIDLGGGFTALLAAQSEIMDRLNALEKKKLKKG